MPGRAFVLVVAAAACLGVGASAAGSQPRIGFLPENSLKIPVGSPADKGLSEAQFNEVLDKVQAIYGPIIEARGGKLNIERNWTDGTVNAYASRSDGTWNIHMYGGLARHQAVTQDGFALVACHELGHHLGGYPKTMGFGWASNEGEADYYAPTKCLRRIFAGSGTSNFTRPRLNDAALLQACQSAWSSPSDRALCERSALAGLSLARLFQDIHHESTAASFDTPDRTRVTATNDNHPATQCRLDTYLQAAICTKPLSQDFSDASPVPGACTGWDGYTIGLRPRCWYKPPTGEPGMPLEAAKAAAGVESARSGAAFSALRQGF